MTVKRMCVVVLFGGLLGLMTTTLSASPILSGTFDLGGTMTVVAGPSPQIDWMLTESPFTPKMADIGSGTGSFAGDTGTVGLQDLSFLTEPVGSVFGPDLFISIPTLTTMLDINFIQAGTDGTAMCGLAPAKGQTCTPLVSPSTPGPFDFSNNLIGTNLVSSAQFFMSGVTSDSKSSWFGSFTVNFNEPYQDVLSGLAATGTVEHTFAASITVTPNPTVAEPGTPALVLLGMVLVVASRARHRRRKAE